MIEQRSPEWHAARIGRVTASSVGGILGLSPFTDRAGVMRAMVREALGAPSEFPDPVPPPVAWGTAMEATAIGEFEMRHRLTVETVGFVPFEDWAGASPDGFIGDDAGVEAKCPYRIRNDPAPVFKMLTDQPHYEAQVQFSLYVTGRARWHFTQYTPHGHADEIAAPSKEWQQDAIPRLRQFHAEYLDALRNPEEHLAPKRVTIDTLDAHKMVAEWDQLSEAIERATERRKELLMDIVSVAGERNADFAGRKLTLTRKEGAVSYAKAIKALAPDADLSAWRGKPSEFWGLR